MGDEFENINRNLNCRFINHFICSKTWNIPTSEYYIEELFQVILTKFTLLCLCFSTFIMVCTQYDRQDFFFFYLLFFKKIQRYTESFKEKLLSELSLIINFLITVGVKGNSKNLFGLMHSDIDKNYNERE